MRRGWVLPAVLALFIAVPLIEIYVIIQVGQAIGAWWTILLLVLDSILGSWLVKREGGRAWRALRTALQSGRMPTTELADGGLILIGGTLMLAPGFVLDVVALFLILPMTRPLFRGVLARFAARRLTVASTAPRPGHDPRGPVIRGEVVDE